MITEEHDGSKERLVLTACVTKSEFLGRIVKLKEPFASEWSNLVYSWTRQFFIKYRQAPGRQIESLFAKWAKETDSKELHLLVNRFLASLSGEYEQNGGEINLDYAVDIAEELFNGVILNRLQEKVHKALSKGFVDEARVLARTHEEVILRGDPPVDVLDLAAQKDSHDARLTTLIHLPGDAGLFYGQELAADSLVAYMAPPKCGKSYELLNIAWHGMRQGRQIAYFQVGDLSRRQILSRFRKRAVYRPLKAGKVKFPTGMVLPGPGELPIIIHEERTYEKEVAWKTAAKALQKRKSESGGEVRLSYHPTNSVTVLDIRSMLEAWDRDGWQAEVVVIDYAGNLAPVDGKDNPVRQTAHTWATMRQISEARHCLVVTANQTNKEGFSSWILTRKHFADSKMILAHVSAFLGINQTAEEKQLGVRRHNFIVRREDGFAETQCLYLAECLDVGNPGVLSALPVTR